MRLAAPSRSAWHRVQAHKLPLAPDLVASLPDTAGWIVADTGKAGHAVRELIWDNGARPAIQSKSNDAVLTCPL